MPGRITELSETQIVADLLKDRRRQAAATTSVQVPQPAKDTFTVAATPATTYTLNAIPYQGSGGSSLNLSLNGVELLEGVDYTVDYTTAIVTVSATLKGTPTPADVLTADYWTTGDLIAATIAADTGGITDTFNRANSATSLGSTSDGNGTWTALGGTWGVIGNQAYCAVSAGSAVNLAAVTTPFADGTAQVTLAVANSSGLAFRVQDINNWWQVFADTTTGGLVLYKVIAGTFNVVTNCGTAASGDVVTAVFSGSSITVKKNGATVGTATDSALSTQTKHGLSLPTNALTARWDDWSFTWG